MKKFDLIGFAINSAFSAMALLEDQGLVFDELKEVYETARAEGREPTEDERAKIKRRAQRRLRNLKKRVRAKNK